MKKKFLLGLLVLVGLFTITGCGRNISKEIIGTWKQEDVNWYLVLYEGGTGKGYNDVNKFKETGYAPQEYKWEIKDDVINITNTLIDTTEGFKLDNNKLISVDGKYIYIKQ